MSGLVINLLLLKVGPHFIPELDTLTFMQLLCFLGLLFSDSPLLNWKNWDLVVGSPIIPQDGSRPGSLLSPHPLDQDGQPPP